MFGLPKSTELSRQLPKKAIYAKFGMNTAAKNRFDADISRITIINEISPATVTISEGVNVKSIYVLLVALKRKEYSEKVIIQLSNLIDQNMIFVLQYEEKVQLVVFHNKMIKTEWINGEEFIIEITGLDLDRIWENIIIQIGGINIEEGRSLEEQIEIDDRREKILKEIARLEKLARSENQPKKKFEIVSNNILVLCPFSSLGSASFCFS